MSMLTAIEIADLRGDHGYLTPGPKVCVTCKEDFPCMYARLMDDHDQMIKAIKQFTRTSYGNSKIWFVQLNVMDKAVAIVDEYE